MSARQNPFGSPRLPAPQGTRPAAIWRHGPVGAAACQMVKLPPTLACSMSTSPCPVAEKSPAYTRSGVPARSGIAP